ncbi:family 16 glycosylhydrolase, partial [bacterium]|nr:family 16 glycosylhydrolase [bacterium]
KAKLPEGIGTWPAIWMLGQNISEVGAYWQTQGYGTTSWPHCGEIDIMEHWGDNQNYVQSALHTPSSYGATINHGGQNIPNASNQFNIYALEWTSEQMVFSVNGNVHYTYKPDFQNSETWPFDAPQYLLMNIAIEPSIASNFTETVMELDYVRVYETSILSSKTESTINDYNLIQNSPNPFNPITSLSYVLAENGLVNITIHDLMGRRVKTLVNNFQTAGFNSILWNATNNKGQPVPAGVYLYTIQAAGLRQTKKMVLIK